MGQFWVDWELWQKMCFVLGVLIAVVLVYGTGVQLRNRWKIKEILARRPDTEARRESDTREKEDDIPFGSRALESGIEIEGIWISHQNTPMPSPMPPGTPVVTRPPSLVSSTPSRAVVTSRPTTGSREYTTLKTNDNQSNDKDETKQPHANTRGYPLLDNGNSGSG